MSDGITFSMDGVEIKAKRGATILEAADEAGIYIPRLCWAAKLAPGGHCRVCTVLINGRPQAACTHPASQGMVVENATEELAKWRKSIIEMLFVEGNHFCMICEKSGNCDLQAVAYRFGITTPKYPYLWPDREIDASHPDVFIDRNRCILCGRCVRASRDLDGKSVFQFVERGPRTRIAVNAEAKLGETNLTVRDQAAQSCPVGALLVKRVGYAIPVGRRLYDTKPIGNDIEEEGGRPDAARR